jgi:type VI protein secretion system component VasK
MPFTFKLNEDALVILRLARAVILFIAALALVALGVAFLWKVTATPSFFDAWFGGWSEDRMLLALLVAGAIVIYPVWRVRRADLRREKNRSDN